MKLKFSIFLILFLFSLESFSKTFQGEDLILFKFPQKFSRLDRKLIIKNSNGKKKEYQSTALEAEDSKKEYKLDWYNDEIDVAAITLRKWESSEIILMWLKTDKTQMITDKNYTPEIKSWSDKGSKFIMERDMDISKYELGGPKGFQIATLENERFKFGELKKGVLSDITWIDDSQFEATNTIIEKVKCESKKNKIDCKEKLFNEQ